MNPLLHVNADLILDSLGDAVYVTDVDRRILYWNKAAEQITGWRPQDMVGQSCFDNILAHVDKDGHPLCGKEHCPLHRSIVTGVSDTCPLIFARRKDGQRVPLEVTVAPIRDASGLTIGGVEVFRDISPIIQDLEKARAIQSVSLQHALPHDPRLRFSAHYLPLDVVGGDYYAIEPLDADRYGVFLADVMGHGIAAALYTMHLSALWDRYHPLVETPSVFAAKINDELNRIVNVGETFAAGICGLIDLARQECVLAGAGNPPALLVDPDGEFRQVECPGLPLGLMQDASYDDTRLALQPGSRLLLFSDGVVDIPSADNTRLGVDGLIRILKKLDFPRSDTFATAIEEELLKSSNVVRLEDDLTLLDIGLAPTT